VSNSKSVPTSLRGSERTLKEPVLGENKPEDEEKHKRMRGWKAFSETKAHIKNK